MCPSFIFSFMKKALKSNNEEVTNSKIKLPLPQYTFFYPFTNTPKCILPCGRAWSKHVNKNFEIVLQAAGDSRVQVKEVSIGPQLYLLEPPDLECWES